MCKASNPGLHRLGPRPVAHSLQQQCWALAGIAQAAACVQTTAQGKTADEPAMLALYKSLLEQDAVSVAALIGLGDFSLGLRTATGILHRPNEQQIQTLRYVLAVMDATARLRKQNKAVERLGKAVSELDRRKVNEPGYSSYDIPWNDLADIYVDTLGSLNKRVQIHGNPTVLQRRDVASKIRGLLLMGVRFAWLWHQLGGRRWHLLVNRRRMWQTTQLMAQSGNTGE